MRANFLDTRSEGDKAPSCTRSCRPDFEGDFRWATREAGFRLVSLVGRVSGGGKGRTILRSTRFTLRSTWFKE